MNEPKCICGHAENMHFGGTREPFRCMKIITKHYSGNVVCTCKEFRPESEPEKAKAAQ